MFRCKEITQSGEVYLRRWYLIRTRWFSLMLHHILLSDDDRAPHNHPFWYVSLLLWGSYVECIFRGRHWQDSVERRALGLVFRRASHTHILVVDKPCWTLVFTGSRKQRWGFFTKQGYVDAYDPGLQR